MMIWRIKRSLIRAYPWRTLLKTELEPFSSTRGGECGGGNAVRCLASQRKKQKNYDLAVPTPSCNELPGQEQHRGVLRDSAYKRVYLRVGQKSDFLCR